MFLQPKHMKYATFFPFFFLFFWHELIITGFSFVNCESKELIYTLSKLVVRISVSNICGFHTDVFSMTPTLRTRTGENTGKLLCWVRNAEESRLVWKCPDSLKHTGILLQSSGIQTQVQHVTVTVTVPHQHFSTNENSRYLGHTSTYFWTKYKIYMYSCQSTEKNNRVSKSLKYLRKA